MVDIFRTSGDGANTVNISTGSSILAAACGARVAKVSLVNYNHNHFYLSRGFS
ncbi:putative anthranilate phosphoribosyltransferase [Helianthus anomalus]